MARTLVILAAGIGSRFGGGIKQLEPVDDFGHIIIDYSIHDAIAAGFDRIVFIIRHDIEADFRSVIGNRIEKICEPLGVKVDYAFQELTDIPIDVPAGRTKPWGTGHAILACRDILQEPFSVINADDYYGKDGFRQAAAFLGKGYALVGYLLKNTLSENGGVTRGVCTLTNGVLTGIKETRNIVKNENGAAVVNDKEIDTHALVSMNFWCYPAEFMEKLKEGFPVFLSEMKDPLKEEFLLPTIADVMIKKGKNYSVLPTFDRWFGVTYREDKPAVMANFRELIRLEEYREDLYSDL